MSSNTGYLRSFACDNCGAQIHLRAMGLTLTASCETCGTIIDVSKPHYRVLQEAQKSMSRPRIPLGTRGKLFNVLWEVIGYLEREDRVSKFSWSEYLLFNPYRGFCWLTESDGHWSQVKALKTKPGRAGSPEIQHQQVIFLKYYQGKVKTKFVLGEFYWRVQVGASVEMVDYVAAPQMLSCELDHSEMQWSTSTYLDPKVIAHEFKVSVDSPRGIAPHQVNPWLKKKRVIFASFAVFVVLALVIQILLVMNRPNRKVFDFALTLRDANTADGRYRTDTFDVPAGARNLSVQMNSPVNHSWLSLAVDLVNETEDETTSGQAEVEYYSGEDWSEGSTRTSILFSDLGAGKYHLELKPSSPATTSFGERTLSADHPYSLIGSVGETNWSNFFLTCLAFGIFPLGAAIAYNGFETQRWSQSDYGPLSGWSDGTDHSEDDWT